MLKTIYKLFHNTYHSRYHGIYTHAKKLFIFDLVLLASTIVLLAVGLFFFFWKPGIADKIDLQISFPNERIRSGEEMKITLNFTNRSKYHLKDVSLALHLPNNFEIDRNRTPEKDFSNNSILNITEMEAGAKGQKEVYGRVWVEPKTEEKITAIMSYTPEGGTGREQKIVSAIMILPESILTTNITLPTTAFSNQPLPVTGSIINNGKIPLTNISLYYTAGTATPIKWKTIDSLQPGETRIFSDTVNLTTPSPSIQFIAALEKNGYSIIQGRIKKDIETISLPLLGEINLPKNLTYVEPGQVFPLTINWKNNSRYNVQGVKMRLNFTPGIVDLKTTARENNLKIDGQSLIIDSNTRTAMANAAAQTAENFTINLHLSQTFSVGQNNGNALEITPIISGSLDAVSGQIMSTTGQSQKITLATELNLKTEARYFTAEGDQLGRGPLPPKVGETTKYWVFIRLLNSVNPIKEVEFQAELASGVTFTGKQSVTIGESINHQPTSQKISWSNYELPANSLTGLYFEVAVTPSPDQLGQKLTLLKNIKFSAVDKITGKVFHLTGIEITNLLSTDDRGRNTGSAVTN